MATFKFNEDSLRKAIGKQIANSAIDITCPACKVKNTIKGDDIARQSTIVCSGCRQPIKLTDTGGEFGKLVRG